MEKYFFIQLKCYLLNKKNNKIFAKGEGKDFFKNCNGNNI